MGNRILAEGFLPGDAQIAYDRDGRPRLNLRFSNQKSHRDPQTNEWINDSETLWFGATVWGPEAEALADKAIKGARVKASGQLIARTYTKDGEQRTALEIEFPAIRIDPPRQQNQSGNSGRNYDATSGQSGWNQAASADPWATGGQTQHQGFNGDSSEPPF